MIKIKIQNSWYVRSSNKELFIIVFGLFLIVSIVCTAPKNCLLFNTIRANVAAGSVYYVDKNSIGGTCSDSNPGTITKPWCSISKANSAVKAGDTVYIRRGRYNEAIEPSKSGSKGNYITFQNYNNEKVTIDLGGDFTAAVNLDSRHYVRIDGLILTDSSSEGFIGQINTGVRCWDASHIIIQNCVISHIKGSWPAAVYGWGCEYITIKDNIMFNIGIPQYVVNWNVKGDAGDLLNMRYFHHSLIEGNTAWLAGHRIFHFMYEIHYNIIRNNRFYNPWEGGGVLGVGNRATYNLIEGNEFFGSAGWNDSYSRVNINMDLRGSRNIVRRNKFYWSHGIGMRIGSADYGANNNKVYNNIYFSNGLYGGTSAKMSHLFLENAWGGSADIGNMFKNNIFWANNSEVACTINKPYDPGCGPCGSSWLYNNIIFQSPGSDVFWPFSTGRTLSYMESNYPNYVSNNLEVDPLLVEDANTELISNNGLESWNSSTNLVNWTEKASGSSTIKRDSNEAYKGNYCAKLTVDSGNSSLVLSQSGIQVKPDTEYYFSFSYRNTVLDEYGSDYKFRIKNEADDYYLDGKGGWYGSAKDIKIRNCVARKGGYLVSSGIVFRTRSNASTLTIFFMNDNAPSSSFYIDEVSLKQIPNFDLLTDSPMIETGTYLTSTTSSGSGTEIPVEDALYFTDGYGLIEGDLIQLDGQPETARIVSVDYSENVITVDRSLTWNSGQGVSLDYIGFYPDLGAIEYNPGKKKHKVKR